MKNKDKKKIKDKEFFNKAIDTLNELEKEKKLKDTLTLDLNLEDNKDK